MAKKAVGKVKSHERSKMAKLIRAVRSSKTGAYTFKETMVPAEALEQLLQQDAA